MSYPYELGNIDNSPIGQTTPAAGQFTILKATTDPVNEHGVGDRGFNDLRYAGVGGGAKADAIHIEVKEGNVAAIKKGQACAITGSSGTKFEIKKCDCDDSNLIRILGIAQADITQNGNGIVVYKGVLTVVDTTSADLNPNSETWLAGDMLWAATTAGGLTNVRPTVGRTIKVARTMKGNSASDTLLVISHTNSIFAAAAAGEDIVLRPGDSAGANKVIVRNYANIEKAVLDTNGNLTLSGTVDGRDITTDGAKLDGIETGADVTDTLAIINSIVCNNSEVVIYDSNVISN